MKKVVCFGEVLWDVFPNYRKIGGAPLNVALRMKSIDNDVSIITRIGDDEDGEEIMGKIKDLGVCTKSVQIDKELKTGDVSVVLNHKGSASYNIHFPRAWDAIEVTDCAVKLVKQSDAFIFGSLVARNVTSKDTLHELLKLAKYKVFDVNLREPYYTNEELIYLMNEANFIKFNDDEIFEIAKALGSKIKSLEQNIEFIANTTNTDSICVTKGRHGAILYHDKSFYYNGGYRITVVDTVGAGDSFLASLIDKLIKDVPAQKAINYATAVGALVASSEGANPNITDRIGELLRH